MVVELLFIRVNFSNNSKAVNRVIPVMIVIAVIRNSNNDADNRIIVLIVIVIVITGMVI